MMNKKGLAIITGASQGIGASVAKGLSQDGYQVVLIARNVGNLQKIAREIRESDYYTKDIEPIIFPLDISNHEAIHDKLATLRNQEKPISILVNSAAMWLDGTLEESIENFQKILDVNVVSQYAILKEIVDIMKEQKAGYIFNIASRAGKYGFAGGGLYGASKFALVGLSESLYRELAPLGIKVTSLCPGWVNTEMARQANTPFKDEEMIQPGDILNSIMYLLSLSDNACIKEIVIECSKSIL
jgi:short-subunit dehydrogenase